MSIQDEVMADFEALLGKPLPLRSARDSGRYASRVRVQAPQGSSFDGCVGVVARVEGESVFVRMTGGRYAGAELPFARGELVEL